MFIDAWQQSTDDVLTLLSELEPEDWDQPTDCPGWSVHDVVAHLAAVEHEMATGQGPGADVLRDGAREVVSSYTDAGVALRVDRTPDELTGELRTATAQRTDQLARLAPEDPAGTPDRTPGGIGWDWQTLLRNRAVDMWVHEQDLRRAVDRAGSMHSPGAEITSAVFAATLPYVIGKRAAAPPGTTVLVRIDDRVTAYSVDESGRCRLTDSVDDPTVRLGMDRETFTALAAGRRDPAGARVTVDGDARLAERILRSMAVTP